MPPSSGLYKLHSRLQHSCAPNCAAGVLFSTGEVLVRTLRDVRRGELLTRSYEGEGFLRLGFAERRQLLEVRGFRCNCDRCREEGRSPCRSGELARVPRKTWEKGAQPHLAVSPQPKALTTLNPQPCALKPSILKPLRPTPYAL